MSVVCESLGLRRGRVNVHRTGPAAIEMTLLPPDPDEADTRSAMHVMSLLMRLLDGQGVVQGKEQEGQEQRKDSGLGGLRGIVGVHGPADVPPGSIPPLGSARAILRLLLRRLGLCTRSDREASGSIRLVRSNHRCSADMALFSIAGVHQGAVGSLKFAPPGRFKHVSGTAGVVVSGGESDGVLCVWGVPEGSSTKEVTYSPST